MPDAGATEHGGREQVGPYRVVGRLGAGGMGVVDEVVHATTGARCALKRLTPAGAADPELRLRFVREAQALATLRHPNVAPILAAELDGPVPWLTQPLLPGGSLADRLRAGPLALPEVRRVFQELLAGLAHAHERGVLHRDLKPENVLFDEQGRAVLTDFGLARLTATDQASLTATGTLMGSPLWMAPEQARDSKSVDARADVYGLGALLYAMLAGRPPFPSEGRGVLSLLTRIQTEPPPPLRGLRPDAPADLVALCERALEKDPGQRWPDAVALQEDLRSAGPARGPRRSLGWPALALALLIAAGTVGGLVLQGPPAPLGSGPSGPHAIATAPGPARPAPTGSSPPPTVASEPRPGGWRAVPLLPGRRRSRPMACFSGDQVVLWTGEGFARCSRWVTRTPEQLEPLPGAPAAPEEQATAFLALAGEALFLGLAGPPPEGGVVAWRQGEAAPPLSCQPDGAALRGRWLAVLDRTEGGRVRVLDSASAAPVATIACAYPRAAVFPPGGQELFVGGGTIPVGDRRNDTGQGVLLRLVQESGRWTPAAEPISFPQPVRCLDVHPAEDLLLVGDDACSLFEVARTEPDPRRPLGRYVRDPNGLTRQAHASGLRGAVYLQGGRVLLSLAEVGGSAPQAEVAVWNAADHTYLGRLPLMPGQVSSALIRTDDGEQALFCTPMQVYLLTPEPEGAPGADPEAKPLGTRGWEAIRLLPQDERVRDAQACFAAGQVLIWTGSELLRCAPPMEAHPALETVPLSEPPPSSAQWITAAGDDIYLGLRTGGLWRIREGSARQVLPQASDLGFVRAGGLFLFERGKGAGRLPLGSPDPARYARWWPQRDATAMDASPDGALLIAVDAPRTSQSGIWQVLTDLDREEPTRREEDATTPVRVLSFAPGGGWLATGDNLGGVMELSWPELRVRSRYVRGDAEPAHRGTIRGLHYVGQGAQLLTLSSTKDDARRDGAQTEVCVWDTRTRRPVGIPLTFDAPLVGGLVGSPDEDLALISTGRQIYLLRPTPR